MSAHTDELYRKLQAQQDKNKLELDRLERATAELRERQRVTFAELCRRHVAEHKCDERTARLAVVRTPEGRAAYNHAEAIHLGRKPPPLPAIAPPPQTVAQLQAEFDRLAANHQGEHGGTPGAARLAVAHTERGRALYNEISRRSR